MYFGDMTIEFPDTELHDLGREFVFDGTDHPSQLGCWKTIALGTTVDTIIRKGKIGGCVLVRGLRTQLNRSGDVAPSRPRTRQQEGVFTMIGNPKYPDYAQRQLIPRIRTQCTSCAYPTPCIHDCGDTMPPLTDCLTTVAVVAHAHSAATV